KRLIIVENLARKQDRANGALGELADFVHSMICPLKRGDNLRLAPGMLSSDQDMNLRVRQRYILYHPAYHGGTRHIDKGLWLLVASPGKAAAFSGSRNDHLDLVCQMRPT